MKEPQGSRLEMFTLCFGMGVLFGFNSVALRFPCGGGRGEEWLF